MPYHTLLTPSVLSAHLDDPAWVIVDCRFDLAQPDQRRLDYLQSHIPGAVYAHLNTDLSSPVVPGVTSRHPLPSIEDTAALFSRLGIDSSVQVVAYDDLGGAIAASRLWWMLNWLGHANVAVLDGGWQAWQREGYPLRPGDESNPLRQFIPRPRPEMLLDAAQVDVLRLDPDWRLLDSRAAERFRGENETIDPVAGHIPGALSAPYAANLDPQGIFLPLDILKTRFEALLGGIPASQAVFYCGSGVTAAHNILAIQHAGLGEARLYAGSWSEWITDPSRPIATGS